MEDLYLCRLLRAIVMAHIDFYLSPHALSSTTFGESCAQQSIAESPVEAQAAREGRDVPPSLAFVPANAVSGDGSPVDVLQPETIRMELGRYLLSLQHTAALWSAQLLDVQVTVHHAVYHAQCSFQQLRSVSSTLCTNRTVLQGCTLQRRVSISLTPLTTFDMSAECLLGGRSKATCSPPQQSSPSSAAAPAPSRKPP